MSTGTYSRGQCFPTQQQAARDWCSSFGGSTSAGDTACVHVELLTPDPETTGGNASFFFYRNTFVAGTAEPVVDTPMAHLGQCETYDWVYWGPIVSLWFGAMVTVILAKSIYTWFFKRETA